MKRILIIEDDPQYQELLREMVAGMGEVITAPDGEVGLALLQRQPVDLVITDILMPHKEGLSVVRELRERDSGIPIIAISGGDKVFPADLLVEVSRITGADLSLQKPFSPQQLREAVHNLLQGP